MEIGIVDDKKDEGDAGIVDDRQEEEEEQEKIIESQLSDFTNASQKAAFEQFQPGFWSESEG